MKSHKKKSMLILGVLIFISGIIPLIIFTFFTDSNHPYTINTITLTSKDGTGLKALVLEPLQKSDSQPGIVVAHGFCGNKHFMQTLSIELVKRGFTVVSIDFRGHGSSEGYLAADRRGSELDEDLIAAVEYLESLGYIDQIGLVGHSMGGFTSIRVAQQYPARINATVTYGAIPPTEQEIKKVSNLLLLNGKYEQIFSEQQALELLQYYTGRDEAEIGVQYGDFLQDTAIKAVLGPYSEHLLEVFDPVLIYEMVKWFEQSFNGIEAADISITAGAYQLSFIIALMGAVILIFLAAVYLGKIFFKGRFHRPEREILERTSIVKMMLLYVLATVIGVLLLAPLALSFSAVLPVAMGHMLYAILVGNAAGVVAVYYLFFMRKNRESRLKNFPIKLKKMCDKGAGASITYGILSALIATMAISSIMHWSITTTLPTLREIGSIFAMVLLFFPFILIKEFYFRQVQGQIRTENKVKEYFSMLGIGVLIDNALLIPPMLLVWQNPNSALAFMALSLSVFIVFSMVQQIFTTWIYMYSGRNILGSAAFLSIFYAWMIVNFFPFGLNSGLL